MPKKTLYIPQQNSPFELSRSKIQLFMECPRCFYLDRSENFRKNRPGGPMSYIPTAIDNLLKNEFDKFRIIQKPHPYFEKNKLNLIPYQHENIDEWRNNRKGIRYHHPETNFIIYGSIDDCWLNLDDKKLHIADYKSTTASYDKDGNIKDANLDEKGAPHKYWYKKQVEIYSWLFKKKEFDISEKAYFLFCNALYKGNVNFNDQLNFKIDIVSYDIDDSWVDNTIFAIKKTLEKAEPPEINQNCNYCNYLHT